MREGIYQRHIIRQLEIMFPGCIILKNDAAYRQGIPDLLILFNDRWAALEVKTSAQAPFQPNQEYYVDRLRSMSYASFIYPAIEEDVLYALQHALGLSRSTRVPQRQ